ncbi:MAG: 4Fe-4S dicluster domain-containing protein [Deltaproteobacteria bacterium]|jgi:Na+-translocating ferredoxin:NAD+ oxidoreductase subunit B|nr:4Fe-4S dicluster domain-containing protein [Deltaproteobacteria bacterium]
MTDVYRKLQERLDDMATGFPATADGVEMKILKRLFTEEDAALFIEMSPLLEKPEDVAERLGREPAALSAQLAAMAQKGLLFRVRKGDRARYAAPPYVVGIFEFQLNEMEGEFARDNDAYFEEALGKEIQAFQTPVLRSIPVKRELVAEWPVAPYEDALEIIKSHKKIAVMPCICRTMNAALDKACDKPLEVCMAFGSHADYYVENNMGRYIQAEEALEVLKKGEEAGLVLQPFNSQKVGGMCSCCGCCCGVLRSLKKQPKPAEMVKSNYFAVVSSEDCIGCETCLDRCQIDAVRMADDTAVVDLDRCIGCGLCVTTCPEEAIRLMKKPESNQYLPPKTGAETYIRIAEERGKLDKLMPS